ncbi:MAG: DegV family protein, partial [Lachnospiraceae bacterium]|nr:DegV family protein [Lachnospiraceae bacterium]
MKLILDSGSDLRKVAGREDYAIVPLSIRTDDKEFVDDEKLNIMGMVEELEKTKGRSGSACPGVREFEKALDGCSEAIIVTLASRLSGCYNSAVAAAEMYMEEHEGSVVYVLDSNAIGPSEKLIAEKFFECKEKGMSIDDTYDCLKEYSGKLKIGFCLKSLKNLANNGRISPVIAKLANVVGIRIVGIFSEWGELQPTD